MENVHALIEEALMTRAIKINTTVPLVLPSTRKTPILFSKEKLFTDKTTRELTLSCMRDIILKNYPSPKNILISSSSNGGNETAKVIAGMLNCTHVEPMLLHYPLKIEPIIKGKNVLLIENIILQNGLLLDAVVKLKKHGAESIGICSIFNCAFENQKQIEGCKLESIFDYENLFSIGVNKHYFSNEDMEQISKWKVNPDQWSEMWETTNPELPLEMYSK